MTEMPANTCYFIVAFTLLSGCSLTPIGKEKVQTSLPDNSAGSGAIARIDVARQYAASGWMGDGEEGTKYIHFNESCTTEPHSGATCMEFSYAPGPVGWAGVYWLNKPQNWGDQPGENLSDKQIKRVTFWARGERGGEIVEFKAGGVSSGKQFQDSFEKSTGELSLSNIWKRYSMDVDGADLSSVIGLFCWSANQANNPRGLTFYLDKIQYE